MKILFASSFIYHSSNGAAIFAQLFLEWARERDHEVDIISDEESKNSFIPLVKHNTVFKRIPFIQPYQRSFIFYKTVENQCEKISYDIIFFNSLYESLHTARFIKHIPVVAFLHDENFMNDYLGSRGFKRRVYRNFMKNLERKACAELQHIVTNSRYMKNCIETIYGVHPMKVDYMYFRSYDLDYKREKIKSGENKKRILFIKHDYVRGGLIELIRAINTIQEYEIELIVIGPEEKDHSKLQSNYLQSKLTLYAYMSREELVEYYKSVDLFCVPSHSEAMGISNFEAMLFGVPVISSRIPIMEELNKEFEMMCLVTNTNEQEFGEAIVEVLKGGEEVDQRVENGRRFVGGELDRNFVFGKLERIIDKVVR